MSMIRILHVDDEPDIREVIEISLGLDPDFELRSCESGSEALAVAAYWKPNVILLDVMMPVMDGPATLSKLRENPGTAAIPVIFMTARAQSREVDRFRALGAIGVIAKPFDPMTLAASVRHYLPDVVDPLKQLRAGFLQRVSRDIAALSQDRDALAAGGRLPHTMDRIKQTAHSLSGAGGIYGFAEISDAAAALEDAAIAWIEGDGSSARLSRVLDELINCAGCGVHRQSEMEDAATR
jgi:CheY-like chemotaxis protein